MMLNSLLSHGVESILTALQYHSLQMMCRSSEAGTTLAQRRGRKLGSWLTRCSNFLDCRARACSQRELSRKVVADIPSRQDLNRCLVLGLPPYASKLHL